MIRDRRAWLCFGLVAVQYVVVRWVAGHLDGPVTMWFGVVLMMASYVVAVPAIFYVIFMRRSKARWRSRGHGGRAEVLDR